MLHKEIEKAINTQILNEMYSSYLYLSMASYSMSIDLEGFANWFRVQAQEETFHAMKFYDYVLQKEGRVLLQAIDQPPHEFGTPMKLFKETLAHEQKVTAMINHLADLAAKHKDHATSVMLQWFVNEQNEEEANANAIIKKIKLAGDNSSTLLMIDQQLATRVFTPPTAAADAAP